MLAQLQTTAMPAETLAMLERAGLSSLLGLRRKEMSLLRCFRDGKLLGNHICTLLSELRVHGCVTQSDMQAINVTLPFLLTRTGYMYVSPTTRETFVVVRLRETGTLAAGISQTLSVRDGEHNHRCSTNTQGPLFVWIFNKN